MKAKFTFLLILSLSLLLVLPLAASGVSDGRLVQVLSTGCIDWSAGTIRVRGVAAPATIDDGESPDTPSDIFDAARRIAQSNLIETVSVIPINAVSRIAERMAQSADFRNGLISLSRNASLTRQEYLSDGTVEIELTMNLTGGFGQFVLPEEIRQVDSVVTMTAGVGGSMLSIGSAAGVGLMGQARGMYTFFGHLKWTPVIALGYAASIYTHFLINASRF